jgi:hypothetical protein
MRESPVGVRLLTGFFIFGACASGVSVVTLLCPGSPLDVLWRVNPQGHGALRAAEAWGVTLMVLVCLLCSFTARGLWLRAWWGHRLAVAMLVLNLAGDSAGALVTGDLRTLIGLPIGAGMIAYLLSPGARAAFQAGATRSG